ncbi:hypothetical protein SAZ_33910 [Streptomyces noursei ZPM]|uniref:Uncharacterized protein n=1 Tax=Streptomyces noursei TaxID=1971 RepID=A0A401RAP7_STRNR|nr:DUF6507 family protein [Streptomyces noursei]AKA06849.1 hypothetical protein SAZ_33910 [Streptomyces noursei ZPM]EXU87862.1 hypothetical protein P354_33170 [Streptomyces noursei PD-1]UWS75386.1 DUF6507 family protein [Streptomyces noursei]GCB94678.1 hypothetical protein SALB_07479 [Streptomyces noursei]
MASWDIQPQGVQGQLKVVGAHAEDLGDVLSGLLADLREAAGAAGTAVPGSQAITPPHGPVVAGNTLRGPAGAPLLSQTSTGPVGAALAQYAAARNNDFKAMADRCQAAVLGAVKATNEYVQGDLEAAKNAQNAARAVRLDALKDVGGKQR